MPPMLPICMSSTTRSGCSRPTVARTSWPRVTSIDALAGPACTPSSRGHGPTWRRRRRGSSSRRFNLADRLFRRRRRDAHAYGGGRQKRKGGQTRWAATHGARRSRGRRGRARARTRSRRDRCAPRARASCAFLADRELLEVGEVRVLRGEPRRAVIDRVVGPGAQSSSARARSRRAARRIPRVDTVHDERLHRECAVGEPVGEERGLLDGVATRRRDEHERGARRPRAAPSSRSARVAEPVLHALERAEEGDHVVDHLGADDPRDRAQEGLRRDACPRGTPHAPASSATGRCGCRAGA